MPVAFKTAALGYEPLGPTDRDPEEVPVAGLRALAHHESSAPA
jgi:hypothetical protein